MAEPLHDPPYTTDRDLLEGEVELQFVKDSGPGGQHRNKRESGVRLFHPPSGVIVTAVERRSQARNRELAFERLIARLEELNHVPKKRRPTRVPYGVRRARLQNKRHRSQVKANRKKVTTD